MAVERKEHWGVGKHFFSFQNRCREAALWEWKTTQTLFGLLVILVILYGCETVVVVHPICSGNKLRKLEAFDYKFKIKSAIFLRYLAK